MLFSLIPLAALPTLATAARYHTSHNHHDHAPGQGLLPDKWYHDEDHPVHALFKRGPTTDGATYPAIDSAAWHALYPTYDDVNSKPVPTAWKDALTRAVQAGKIPDIPVTTVKMGQNPVYPNGLKGTDANVCSGTLECRINGTIWDAPTGVIGIGFDDGPQPPSPKLSAYLKQQNQAATHFMIGKNILAFPKEFTTAFENGDDLAVHTYSHQYMTTQTNDQALAELGWTMQIIHDSSGGRVPKYWRPPYGDSDMRTTAIAKEVFGMTAMHWNQNTADFELAAGGTTSAEVAKLFDGWLKGPKTPGLLVLEHETSDQSVDAFIAAYPKFKQNGWNPISQARMFGTQYQNAAGITDPVTVDNVVAGDGTGNSVTLSNAASTTKGSTGTKSSTKSSTATSSAASATSSSAGTALEITSTRLFAVTFGIITTSGFFWLL